MKKGAEFLQQKSPDEMIVPLIKRLLKVFSGQNNLWLYVHLIDSSKLLEAKVRLTLLDVHLMLILLSL